MFLDKTGHSPASFIYTFAELTDKGYFCVEDWGKGYNIETDAFDIDYVNKLLNLNDLRELIETNTRVNTQMFYTQAFSNKVIPPNRIQGFIPRFRFKEWHGTYLITNDCGKMMKVDNELFMRMVHNNLLPDDKTLLRKSFFYIDSINWKSACFELRKTWYKYRGGPNTFVLKFTNACNYNCVYCQAGSSNHNADQMCTIETGRNTVNLMAESPNTVVVLEIQGGEPLLNWDVVRETVLYAEEVMQSVGKTLKVRMMTNLSLVTEEIMKFCIEHNIDVGSSVDGPKEIHDANRPACNGCSSYDATTKGLELVKAMRGHIGYLTTVTRESLPHVEEIVSKSIAEQHNYNCRPLFKLGRAIDVFDEIGYTPEEFLDYFRKSVNVCINASLNGDSGAHELRTKVLANKVLNNINGDIELGTPCGAIQCMVSIDWNGDIMACEGSKMLREPYRSEFVTANVNTPGIHYADVFFNSKSLSIIRRAFNEDDSKCSRCVYAPYCGNCAVERTENDSYTTFNCAINEGMLDNLVQLLENEVTRPVIEHWANDLSHC